MKYPIVPNSLLFFWSSSLLDALSYLTGHLAQGLVAGGLPPPLSVQPNGKFNSIINIINITNNINITNITLILLLMFFTHSTHRLTTLSTTPVRSLFQFFRYFAFLCSIFSFQRVALWPQGPLSLKWFMMPSANGFSQKQQQSCCKGWQTVEEVVVHVLHKSDHGIFLLGHWWWHPFLFLLVGHGDVNRSVGYT